MNDPVGAITNITGQVLRRIADALDTNVVEPVQPIIVNVEHLHVTAPPSQLRGLLKRGQ